ncbi:hypothetical protein BKA65DRAFT_533411 [Rhexocercosporidium sp. MPI-PUGE-AT-0058]|nr:hypothetical protein BKA65DRAFT_533411 [Rhexocercosporidium sp. MPI-PUGE-AT-0058]
MPLYSSNTQLPQQPKECESSMPSPSHLLRRHQTMRSLYSLNHLSANPFTEHLTNTTVHATRNYSLYVRLGSREKPVECWSAGQVKVISLGVTLFPLLDHDEFLSILGPSAAPGLCGLSLVIAKERIGKDDNWLNSVTHLAPISGTCPQCSDAFRECARGVAIARRMARAKKGKKMKRRRCCQEEAKEAAEIRQQRSSPNSAPKSQVSSALIRKSRSRGRGKQRPRSEFRDPRSDPAAPQNEEKRRGTNPTKNIVDAHQPIGIWRRIGGLPRAGVLNGLNLNSAIGEQYPLSGLRPQTSDLKSRSYLIRYFSRRMIRGSSGWLSGS